MKKKKIVYSFLISISVILYSISVYTIRSFGGSDMYQIIYALSLPAGTSISALLDGIFYCLKAVLILDLICLLPIFISFNYRGRNINLKYKGIYSLVLCFMLLAMSVYKIQLLDFIYYEFQDSTFIEDNYVDPKDVEITFPDKKKNLIYIFMESMEATYANMQISNEKINFIPNLTRLANDNISFSNNNTLGGFPNFQQANWTVAGTLSQISGLPLKVRLNFTDYGYNNSFLPNVTMLGDILEKEGYNNIYLIGSDANFGASDILFATHGNYQIHDYNYAIEKGYIDEDYYIFWGYEDRILFDIAKKDISFLANNNTPFSLVMATIDSHPIDGYQDEKCNYNYDYLYGNSIACDDEQIASFISWIKNQDFYEDTVIIIAGDHKSMQSDISNYIENKDDRYIYNAFINTGLATNYINNRNFSPFDMFPTTIAALGANIDGDRLGLGTNLFSGKKTISEEIGTDNLAKEIKKYSKYYFQNLVK